MNGHVNTWIDAYLDGELPSSQRQQVEAHMALCQDCQELLEQRRTLSSWLQQVPPAAPLKPEEQFIAEVGLRLSRQQLPDLPQQGVLRLGWHLIPVGLLSALAFIQAVMILSNLLSLFPGASNALVGQATALPAFPVMLPGVLDDLLSLLGIFNLLDWSWLTGFAALTITGLMYLAWLAGWWVRSRNDHEDLFIAERS